MLNFLKCLLQLILSPGMGWEDISHQGRERSDLLRRGLFPFICIAAASAFVPLFYSGGPTIVVSFIRAVILLVSLWAGFYIAGFVMPLLLPDCTGGDYNDKRTSSFIIYSTALMALVILIQEVLPFDVGVTWFLPVYVGLVMWKGSKYVGVQPSRQGYFVVLAVCSVILPPYLLIWLFNILL